MTIPVPVPGLVISYSYLWKSESDLGFEEGRKDRPCVVILAVEETEKGITVSVAPITHSPPDDPVSKIKIPVRTGQRLNLDGEDSWVVVSEINRFIWPGPDLRHTPNSNPKKFDYGPLPHKFYNHIKSQFLNYYKNGNLKSVVRSK